MKLVNPTDDQLDAAFAEHIRGWKPEPLGWFSIEGFEGLFAPEEVATSFDRVLPWLEKAGRWSAIRGANGLYEINLDDKPMPETGVYWAIDASLPRAATIALLRAHGVEVEFDPAKTAG